MSRGPKIRRRGVARSLPVLPFTIGCNPFPARTLRMRGAVILLVLLAALLPRALHAQSPIAVDVHGTVAAAGSGGPIAGALISIDGSDQREVTSDADGRFTISGIASGSNLKIVVTANAFREWSSPAITVTPAVSSPVKPTVR